jgi:hypothetical protein
MTFGAGDCDVQRVDERRHEPWEESNMRCLRSFALAAGLAAGPVALAQSTTTGSTVTYSLSWDDTGNHNGEIEPGESALFTMGVSFTGQNSVATFSPPIATFGSGTIRGFGSGFLDLHVTGQTGTWNVNSAQGFGVVPEWNLTGGQGNGTQVGNDLLNLEMGQFVPTPEAIVTTNPIATIWRGLWTPSGFGFTHIDFQIGAAAASGGFHSSVLFRVSSSTLFAAYAPASFGHVSIIIPAPWTLSILAAPFVSRRRRR